MAYFGESLINSLKGDGPKPLSIQGGGTLYMVRVAFQIKGKERDAIVDFIERISPRGLLAGPIRATMQVLIDIGIEQCMDWQNFYDVAPPPGYELHEWRAKWPNPSKITIDNAWEIPELLDRLNDMLGVRKVNCLLVLVVV
jgi:hypothetical protein